nr:hypothetical protein BaRGS_006755 [Batillaria attramentaria]
MSMKKGEPLVQQGLSHVISPYDQLQNTEMTTFSARAGQDGPGEGNAAPSWTRLGETSAGGDGIIMQPGPDGRLYRVMKNSQIFVTNP